jgi:hypothetical protein
LKLEGNAKKEKTIADDEEQELKKSATRSERQENRRERISSRTSRVNTEPPTKSISPSQEAEEHDQEDKEEEDAEKSENAMKTRRPESHSPTNVVSIADEKLKKRAARSSDRQENRKEGIVARTTGEVIKPTPTSVSPSQEAEHDQEQD